MKVSFDKITDKTKRYDFSGIDWFPQELGNFDAKEPVWISLCRLTAEDVILQGNINGILLCVCGRCGDEVEYNMQSSFEYLITTRKEEIPDLQEVECSESDVDTLYLLVPEIDLDEILREQAYLENPIRVLCSDKCKGVCVGCGAVLTSESCRCSEYNSDSPFAILGKAFKK